MIQFCRPLLLVVLLTVSGCATTADDDPDRNLNINLAGSARTPASKQVKFSPQPNTENTEASLIYNLLVAEIAGSRNLPGIAADHYIAAVEQHPDIALAQRATQIAIFARDFGLAERAANIWLSLEPDRVEPRQVLATVYMQQNNRSAAREHLLALLQLRDLKSSKQYLSLARFFATKEDQRAMLTVLEEIADARPEDGEAQFAAAVMAVRFNDYSKAEEYSQAAVNLRPEWGEATMLHAQVLALNDDPDRGIALLRGYIAEHPEQKQAQHSLARMLIDVNQPDAARDEFDRIHQADPDNAEALFALGLLNLQLGELEAARTHLLALEAKGFQENRVHYYLGKLAERLGEPQQALKWYSSITDREYRVDAATRMAYLMAHQGDLDQALKLLDQTETTRNNEQSQLAVTRSDILIHARRYEEAITVATEALAITPDHVDLLFSRSSAYERSQNFDAMEDDIRAILVIHPDNTHALNALGYSLADRNLRLPEAHALLTKALALEPENPYILDSMGWVEYRLGNFEKALPYLRKALAAMPDGEVYAHLATVLIATGAQQDAKILLQEGLAKIPDNTEILKALTNLHSLSESR